MKKRQVFGLVLLVFALVAAGFLAALGIPVFTEESNVTTQVRTGIFPTTVTEVSVRPNWRVAVALALIGASGIAYLLIPARQRG